MLTRDRFYDVNISVNNNAVEDAITGVFL